MRKIAYVTNYQIKNNVVKYPSNSNYLIQFLSDFDDVCLIDPGKQGNNPEVLAYSMILSRELRIPPSEFDIFYTGKAYRPLKSDPKAYTHINCLSSQIDEFLKILELFSAFENTIQFINPKAVILDNYSKDYILELSRETDFPFIPTRKVENLDDLRKLKNSKRKILIKPLVSERALGTRLLQHMSDGDLFNYYQKYSSITGISRSRTHNKQGIIAQPFKEEFGLYGEKKISVVKGLITLSRNTIGKKKSVVSAASGSRLIKYTPSPEENSLAESIFEYMKRKYGIVFLRVDLTGRDGNLYINEIEMINPNFFEDLIPYEESILRSHYAEMFSISAA